MFKILKCKDKAVYTTKLEKQKSLDLNNISKKFKTIQKTPILLLIEVDDCEIIVHRHAELMFKNCEDKEKIKKIAEMVYKEGI
jgi:hypothetical protein